MQQKALQLLNDIYNHYLQNPGKDYHISFADFSLEKDLDTVNSLYCLKGCGYIHYIGKTMGNYRFKITEDGVRFVENQ